MELLRTKKFYSHGIDFEMYTYRHGNRSTLSIEPSEVTKGPRTDLPQFNVEIKIHRLDLEPEEYAGYSEALANVRTSLRNYAGSEYPQQG